MKKRLLSAALALAMVLTLLPVTAFAASPWETTSGDNSPENATYTTGTGTSVVTHSYYEDVNGRITTVTVTRCTAANPTTGQEYGKWYWQKNKGNDAQTPKYMEVQSGIVTGTGGTGQWYPDVTSAYTNTNATTGNETVKGQFTVLGTSVDLDLSSYKDTSLTLAITNSTAALEIPATLTQLRVTAPFQATPGGVMGKGQVAAITTTRSTTVTGGTNTGLTITADNINFGAISLSGRANTLNLTNCTGAGITMDGATITTVGGSTPNSWGAQTINATGCGNLGAIAITNSNGGGVTLQDSTAGTIGFQSDAGSVNVRGQSTTGLITVAARTTTGNYPTVNVTGGTVAGVTQTAVANNDKAVTINVSGTTTNFGAITVGSKGSVTIDSADGTSVTVPEGSVKINGTGVHVSGAMALAASGKTTLDINAGNSTFGSITTTAGANLTIGNWNGKRQRDGGNNYGTLTLTGYDGKKVTGGTFASGMSTAFGGVTCIPWLDTVNLQFFASNGTSIDLYGKTELARAISDLGQTQATDDDGITVLGQNASKGYLVLKTGNTTWAKIGYNDWTPMYLPDKINGMTITTWYAPSNHNIMLYTNKVENVPPVAADGELVLNATGSSNTAASKITKATTAVANNPGDVVQNQNVTATLTGNNIHLTGAVSANVGGLANILVDLETDVVDESGAFITIEDVAINYNVGSKSVSFSSIQPESATDIGVVVINGELVLNNGTGAHYTVTANLTESASRLGIVTDSDTYQKIVVTFGGTEASKTAAQKQVITDALAGENSDFTYGNNRAMQQAINAAQATITSNNSVESWITNTKNTIWRSGFKSPNTTENTNYGYADSMAPHTGNFNSASTDGGVINSKFDKAYIVPYLVVNVTQYDPAGTMTATLTPYYRVDVSASTGYDPDYAYTVQQGRALSLTGVMTGAAADEVKVTFGDNLPAAFATRYMHQDGKYVYTGAVKAWTITHVGTNGTLGTVVINDKEGLVSIASVAVTNGPAVIGTGRTPTLAELGCTYDTLQAAIDDTVRGNMVQTDDDIGFTTETMDTVVIDGQYTGSGAITVTGSARKIYVVARGQQSVTCTSSGVKVRDVTTQIADGYVYIIEQSQDTAPTGGNITISSATGGTASVNANPASAGQTVTITLSANSGYTPNGVSVKDSSGKTVSVSGSGSTYTFTMPSGSVTVTPSFTQSQTQSRATVTVSNPIQGSGTAATSAGNNQVNAGTLVTVTTTPGTNQRTMGLSVTGTTAVRTGVNTFQFSVPSGVSNVVVTPSFDTNNGTNFSDVWSSEYFSNPVSWAVSKGITNGTGTYTFSPNNSCTREDMVTFLWRANGSPVMSNVQNPFWDVQAGSYYYNAVMWAVSKGITNGVSSTQFGVGQTVTRAQAVTFLYRASNSPASSTNSGFYDVPSNEYYARAVTWAKNKGVTDGTSTYAFSPNDPCLRGQIVTFLYRDITGNKA